MATPAPCLSPCALLPTRLAAWSYLRRRQAFPGLCLMHTRRLGASAALVTRLPGSGGVRLPAGTELRADYKGQTYLARVASGALTYNGKRFNSPSAAAMSITRNPVNGWTFWECRLPGQGRWTRLKELRRSK